MLKHAAAFVPNKNHVPNKPNMNKVETYTRPGFIVGGALTQSSNQYYSRTKMSLNLVPS